MTDEIRLKAPTVEQQIVIQVNGEEKIKSLSDTLDRLSNNKNLQKYWKTQQELINATTDAYGNFQKKASKDNASELIKTTNALKAVSGTDLSQIVPDFSEISKSLLEAQKIIGNIDEAFSVKTFKEAFDAFETLKAYGVDIEKLFSHFGVSTDVSELQQNVRLLENEVGKLTRRLSYAKDANEALRSEFENYKTGSGFADKLDELDNLQAKMADIRAQAQETFSQFLELNNISRDGYDEDGYYNDDRFRKYFDAIQEGSLTATDAITEFKREYAYLLEESFKSSDNNFGLDQLQEFSDKLDSIFHQVEETSNKINGIIENGVIAKSVQNLSEDTSLSDHQRSLFGDLLKDEESLKSVTTLFQKLIEESQKTKNTDVFNEGQFEQIKKLFQNIEQSLSAIKGVLVDVGDGEELSPLLKKLEEIREVTDGIKLKFNMNIDFGSNSEFDAEFQKKQAVLLSSYENLFKNLFGHNAPFADQLYDFINNGINQCTTVAEKIAGYETSLNQLRKQSMIVYGEDLFSNKAYKKYFNQVSSAKRSLTMFKNANNGDGDVLDNLFGSKEELSTIIRKLGEISKKLNEISTAAKTFSDNFSQGLNIAVSIDEVETLTQKVRDLEDELAKVKAVVPTNPVDIPTSVPEPQVENNNQGDNDYVDFEALFAEGYGEKISLDPEKTIQALESNFGKLEKSIKQELTELLNTVTQETASSLERSILGILTESDNFISSTYDGYDEDDQQSQLRDFIRNSKIKYSPDYRAEFGDDWNKVNATLGFTSNNGTDIITVLSEANDALGTTFDLTVSNQDAIRQLYEALSKKPDISIDSLPNDVRDIVSQVVDECKVGEQAVENILNPTSETNISSENLEAKSLEELIQLYHELGTTTGTEGELSKISDAILNIVQAEKQLDASEMQTFVNVLKGLTFVDGDSPILKTPYSVDQATAILGNLSSAIGQQNEYQEELEETKKDLSELASIQDLISKKKDGNYSQTLVNGLSDAMVEMKQLYDAGQTESIEYYGVLNKILNIQKEMWKYSGGKTKKPADQLSASNPDYQDRLDLQDSIENDFMQFKTTSSDVVDFVIQQFTNMRHGAKDAFIGIFDDSGKILSQKIRESFSENMPHIEEAIPQDQMKDAFQGETGSGNVTEIRENLQEVVPVENQVAENFQEIRQETDKAVESGKEYAHILSQVGEWNVDDTVSAVYKLNDGQIESKRWKSKKDEEGNTIYDKNGNIAYGEPVITVISKYEQLEKIFIKADNELRNLESDLAKIKQSDPSASTTNIERRITLQKEYIDLLDRTVKAISSSEEYLLAEQQITEARNKAAEEYTLKQGSKKEISSAKQVVVEEQKRQRNIEQTNRLLNRQQITINGIAKSYNKMANPDLDKAVENPDDLKQLAKKKQKIQGLINKLSGQERNSSNEKEFLRIEKLIAEYKQLAKDKLKANNPSKQQLGGENLKSLLENQVSQYNKLIAQAEKYGSVTEEITTELKKQRDLIAEQDKNGVYRARFTKADGSKLTADDYYEARDSYKINKSVLESYKTDSPELKKQIATYNELITTIEKYKSSATLIAKGNGTDELDAEVATLQVRIEELQNSPILSKEQLQSARDMLEKIEDKLIEIQGTAAVAATKKAEDALPSYSNTLQSYEKSIKKLQDGGWASPTFVSNVNAIKTALDNYKNAIVEVKQKTADGIATQEDVDKLNRYKLALEDAINTTKGMSSSEKGYTFLAGQKELDKINKILKENSAMSKEAKKQIRAYYDQIKYGNPSASLETIHGEIMEIVNAEVEAGRGGKSLLGVIKDKAWYGLASQIGMYFGLNDFIRYIREGIDVVTELDTALTEMRKVSDETVTSLKAYQETTFDVADAVGTTAVQIQNSTADWMMVYPLSLYTVTYKCKSSQIRGHPEMDNPEGNAKMIFCVPQRSQLKR